MFDNDSNNITKVSIVVQENAEIFNPVLFTKDSTEP